MLEGDRPQQRMLQWLPELTSVTTIRAAATKLNQHTGKSPSWTCKSFNCIYEFLNSCNSGCAVHHCLTSGYPAYNNVVKCITVPQPRLQESRLLARLTCSGGRRTNTFRRLGSRCCSCVSAAAPAAVAAAADFVVAMVAENFF